MKFKVIHWLLILWIILLAFRYDLLLQYLSLFFGYAGLLIADPGSAIDVLSLKLFDVIFSLISFIILAPICVIFRNKWKFLRDRLNFSYSILLLLVWILIFAPVITNENAEFSKNLSVTKLLPPLKSVKVINLIGEYHNKVSSDKEKFISQLGRVIKPEFNERIIFADSVLISGGVIFFQKDQRRELKIEKLLLEDGKPLIGNKLFLLGTDEYGRDNFARLVYGTRISLLVASGAVILSFIIGVVLGFIAGYGGGFLDTALNRLTELFLAFPVIYLIVLILALFGNSLLSVIVVLGISGWMTLFKIVRSEVISLKHKDFFISAEMIGLRKSQLLAREILPVILAPVAVNLVFLFSNIVLAEAALSYLGLGTGSFHPSWGAMINSGQEYIYKAWWLILSPGVALVTTLIAINLTGKRIQDMINPG